MSGDNDLGGESEPVSAERAAWFRSAFPDSPADTLPRLLRHMRIFKVLLVQFERKDSAAVSQIRFHAPFCDTA